MTRRAIEVVHVGSASRDLTSDDPRGWRLGGGVTYAALTTARLGLRTAALIGVDEAGANSTELDLLRSAGVDLVVDRLAKSPVFTNQETPAGRIQICHVVGDPVARPRPPGGVAVGQGVVAGAGRRRDPRRVGRRRPGGRVPGARLAGVPARSRRRRARRAARSPTVGAAPSRRPHRREPSRRRGRDEPGHARGSSCIRAPACWSPKGAWAA